MDGYPTVRARVATFNVRYGTADDGPNCWSSRREILLRAVRSLAPDILSTQEALPFQLDEVDTANPSMGRFGVGRYHGVDVPRPHETYSGEHCAVYYRWAKFELLESRTEWLSDTPDVPGSLGWGAELARVVTIGRLRSLHGARDLVILNTHFHWGREIVRRSTDHLLRLLSHVSADQSVVVTGDFNLPPTSLEHRRLLSLALVGGRHLLDPLANHSGGSCHDFDGKPKQRIDWVLFSDDIKPAGAEVVTYNEQGSYPSDHFPVVVDVDLPLADRPGTPASIGDTRR